MAKPQQSLGDYVTIALSPVLIMALIGSLVFFLVEVLYEGDLAGQLEWTLFFFVFGMVLVARISIEFAGSGKAGLYGMALAAVSLFAIHSYVKYPTESQATWGWLVNLGFLALISWCAYKLTWDCTYIDDSVDASGKGLLEAAGLDKNAREPEDVDILEEAKEPKKKKKKPLVGGMAGWLDRYQRYRERERKKPHTPGVWVVYFSLAALPIFGVGQSLIPATQGDRRLRVFWLMVIYVASGLGLLLTTTYLGLRRYLRQRNLTMPASMTGIWLLFGGGLLAGLMVVAALIPRPYGEYKLIDIGKIGGAKDKKASQYAVRKGGAGKGQGKASSDQPNKDQKGEEGSGTKSDKQGGQGKSKTKGGKGGKSRSAADSKNGKKADDKNQGKASSRQSDQANQKKPSDEEAEKEKDEQKDKQDEEEQKSSGSQQDSRSDSAQEQESSSVSKLTDKFSGLAKILKWIILAVIGLAFLFYVFRSGLRFLANFTDWAKNLLAWWHGLFAGQKTASPAEEEAEYQEKKARPRPFSSYTNPFESGAAHSMSPEELVAYSFEALQSWAWERHLERRPEETVLEFTERLIEEVPALESETKRLSALYARAAYARGRLPSGSKDVMEKFWTRLEAAERTPLSA
jgi:hypothetical protein